MQPEKARWVCTTCKARKKACDKALPICGYCKKRHLACTYDDGPTSSETVRWNDTYRSAIGVTVSTMPQQRRHQSYLASERATIDGMMYDRVCQIIRLADISIPEMSNKFFRGFHKMFPIISADALQNSLLRSEGSVPPADLSLLILSMYLVTLNPSEKYKELGTPTTEFYVTIKTLFGHVQALYTTSIYMVQAGLLVAGYEYACSRPAAAYVSLGISARMNTINDSKKVRREIHNDDMNQRMKTSVETNVVWGIVILERLILCEMDNVHERPVTKFPDEDFEQPSDLDLGNCSWLTSSPRSLNTNDPKRQPAATEKGNFKQQTQAVALLDHVLSGIQIPNDNESKQIDLSAIDAKLQDFLHSGLAENGWAWGASYGALAIIIRSLFLLHQHILSQSRSPLSESSPSEHEQMSRNALDMATRIMIDTSHDHVDHGMPHHVDTLPLCGGYNLRCAIEHVETNYEAINNKRYSNDLPKLIKLCDAFYRRWRPLGE